MRKFLLTAAALLLLVTVVGVFSTVSFADGATGESFIQSEELTLGAEQDYAFYMQMRTNRLDSSKTDVRFICVASQEWINAIPNYVATFNFTDGVTPKSISVGIDVVFKEIVAYGNDGIETYVAPEGGVLFGWVITDVPAEYLANAPTYAVTTEAGVEPQIKPDGKDWSTPISENTTINALTDGIYKNVSLNGKVGDFGGDSSATYIVTGNYEGWYNLTVKYTDQENRSFLVVVNGENYSLTTVDVVGWDDVNNPGSVTIPVLMKKGANIIKFARGGGNTPNLVDFDLTRADFELSDTSITTKADQYTELNNGGHGVETCDDDNDDDNSVKKIGWIENSSNSVTYTVTAPAAGQYMLQMKYLSQDGARSFTYTVNAGDKQYMMISATDNWNSFSNAKITTAFVELTEGENTFIFSGNDRYSYTSQAPSIIEFTLVPVVATVE